MIDKSALKKLSHKNEKAPLQWYKLIRDILENKPIQHSISFPRYDFPNEAILYLYNELPKNKIEQEVFEYGFLKVFDFYRLNENYIEELYWLLFLMEDIPFPNHTAKFINIVLQEELLGKSHNGIDIHYLLMNQIMPFDDLKKLKHYLQLKSRNKQPPLFYQAVIRYFGDNPNISEFIRVMDNLEKNSPIEAIPIIVESFDEIAFVHKSVDYISEWALKRLGENKILDIKPELKNEMTLWLEGLKEDKEPFWTDRFQWLLEIVRIDSITSTRGYLIGE